VVVKADGLASGKGVFVCSTDQEAQFAIKQILENRVFGNSGNKIVVEDKLEGNEASCIFLCDGETSLDFGTAVDHKRAYDGDRGPNTGGMGAYSPAPDIREEEYRNLKEKIVEPVVKATGFRGFLFLGLMFDEKNRPFVLEFNVRLGDPEAQAILPRLDCDLISILSDTVYGAKSFREIGELEWNNEWSCTVAMCSEGYPEKPVTGDQIKGIEAAEAVPAVRVFHSGTVLRGDSFFTSGGRVLAITGLGNSLHEASHQAYSAVSLISWRGERHRRDIALS
jgi:phosphoribosylamine---glycine ligase